MTIKQFFFQAFLTEVHGLLQFLVIWQETAPSKSRLYTLTRVSYFETFRLAFTPTTTKIVHEAEFTPLFYFSDLSEIYFVFKITAESRFYLYQNGEGSIGHYEIKFIVSKFLISLKKKFTNLNDRSFR